ncbi:hypothetical protein FALCPG4_001884 [Fusarium falciforme]
MSMVLLLQGACMSLLQTQEYELYDWIILHKLFTISQPDPGNESMRRKILTAKTDGCLQARHKGRDPDKGDALATMEAKPYRRDFPENNATVIRIQEGAERTAWISTEARKGLLPSRSDGKTIYRRLLISLDFDQVFLTIAEFDERYIQYITGNDEGWPGAPMLDPLVTPSRDARLQVDQRSGKPPSPPRTGDSRLSLQESLGRKKDESKDTKPSVPGAFRSSSNSASSSVPAHLADLVSLLVRSRGNTPPGLGHPSVPVTPIKSSSRPQEPPPAPRQSAHAAANIGEGTGGLLRMREYKPFYIINPAHMQELSLLVYSLTKYLVEHEDRGRFRPKP